MEEQKKIRDKWLHLRLDETEYQLLLKQFRKTTEPHLSKYARKILLGQPMIGKLRNESLQEIIFTLSKLQKDLNGIGNNYNQMVHKLHLASNAAHVKIWMDAYEKERENMEQSIRIIRDYIEKTAEKWLR
ncbi:plasmid mobilization protein [Pedobacter panaciterrae]|uniref:plasmid mobilization protein n=1 Tax=Pedobacter panaciterrae TaxID=363849 RepID=UPI0025965EAB|nr:plasmid mobilization relaxosome protein MobC [uncultured Pedobacter sp.]